MKNSVIAGHINKIDEYIYKTLQNDEMDLVQLIERINSYANLETITSYAKRNNLSYNGVKKCRNCLLYTSPSPRD